MSQKKQVTFEECMQNIQTYIKRPENIELIQRAYDFAYKHHEGQFRKSGEPYVVHVIQVANTLALLHCGPKTIAAGLLHDTVEDCEGVTDEVITQEFGEEICTLLNAITFSLFNKIFNLFIFFRLLPATIVNFLLRWQKTFVLS